MHEKSSCAVTRDRILNHPKVQSMDAHEQHALAMCTNKMTLAELDSEFRQLTQ